MNEQSGNVNSSGPAEAEANLVFLVKKMHEQLAFLEKKIDMLIKQSQERPPRPSGNRPYRPRPDYDQRGRSEGSGERGAYGGSYFKKSRGPEHRGFSGPQKEYGAGRDSGSGDRPFKKKYGEKKRGFAPGKKPFFQKRKDR